MVFLHWLSTGKRSDYCRRNQCNSGEVDHDEKTIPNNNIQDPSHVTIIDTDNSTTTTATGALSSRRDHNGDFDPNLLAPVNKLDDEVTLNHVSPKS